MGRPRKYFIAELTNQLFDALVSAPQGLTIHELADQLEVPERVVTDVIRALRLQLGDDDEINCVYLKDGWARRYVLAGNIEDASERHYIRLKTLLANIETDTAVWASIVRNSDGRSREGRMARLVHKQFRRLHEDLMEINNGDDNGNASG